MMSGDDYIYIYMHISTFYSNMPDVLLAMSATSLCTCVFVKGLNKLAATSIEHACALLAPSY